MKRRSILLAVAAIVIGASVASAADTVPVEFVLDKSPSCIANASTPTITFIFSGSDTDTQNGTLGLRCTVGTSPAVTVDGLGSGTGYDWSGNMTNGVDTILVTGVFTGTAPVGTGLGNQLWWDYQATASGLIAAPPGHYTTTLTFTINP